MAVQELSIIRDSDYDNDPRGLLIYWDCINNIHPLLEPTKPISDPNIIIGKVGQQNLLTTHFTLKSKDLEDTEITDEEGLIIGKPVPAGISAFLFFGSRQSRQHDLDSISKSHLGREAHYKNRLYIAQSQDIAEAGWTTFYAPLINRRYPIYNPLHVIMVPNSIMATGIIADATPVEKAALVNTFVKWNC